MKSSEIRLGAFVFDRNSGQLFAAGGHEVTLRHQTRQVLQKLAESPGEVVSRQSFLLDVWDGAHVSDDSLAHCISEIRHAMDDTAKTIVETVPRKGYRLNPNPSARMMRLPRKLVPGTAVFLVLALGLAAYFLWPAGPGYRVVAVLPFHDDSPESENGKLGDAISEGILANLARYPELTVIARNSSFRFRGEDKDIREIGEALGANFLLEGSQQLENRNLRVNVRLIDVRRSASVWSDQIDTDLNRLIEVNGLISRRVAHAVEARISDIGALESGENEVDALLLHHKSHRLLLNGPSRENVNRAIAIDTRTIDLYPEEPWGHIGLAFSLRTQLRFGWAENPDETLSKALRHARIAVRMAPENYIAHMALGRVYMQSGDQPRAIDAFEIAQSLNPSSAYVLNALAQAHFYLGENERAFAAIARSEQIDPLADFILPWMKSWALWQVRQCDAALRSFARISTPRLPANKLLAAIHICRGDSTSAEKALATFLASEPGWTLSKERALHAGIWIADGALDQWLDDLNAAGLE